MVSCINHEVMEWYAHTVMIPPENILHVRRPFAHEPIRILNSLLGGCLDLVDQQGAGGCSGVGDCCEVSWC